MQFQCGMKIKFVVVVVVVVVTWDACRAGHVSVWVGYLFFLHGMPAGQAVSRFGSGIFFFLVVVTNLHINLLHGMSARQAMSRFGSGIFFFFFFFFFFLFFFFYTGCPQGRPCLGLHRVSLFFSSS